MQPPPLIESRVGVVVKALNFPGGDSYMEQTRMLIRNFEFNP